MTIFNLFESDISTSNFSHQRDTLIGRKMKITSYEDVHALLKPELAILLEISQNSTLDVKRYLVKKEIDAVLLTMKPKDGKKEIDPENREEWESIVKDFSRLLDAVYENFRPKRLHIFLSAPASLAFGIGCTIRNLRRPYIYNYNRGKESYDLVLIADDKLR